MKQYLQLAQDIKDLGTLKPAARAGMPGTISRFGYQFRHDLADGFPLLTTKKISFKNIVTELLWFLRGDINIKFLIDNSCNIWNEDAYNYYKKIASKNTDESWNAIYMPISKEGGRKTLIGCDQIESYSMFTFDEFVNIIKGYNEEGLKTFFSAHNYTLGDCGFQYGKVWRDWEGLKNDVISLNTEILTQHQKAEFKAEWEKARSTGDSVILHGALNPTVIHKQVDQIKTVLRSLLNTPESRRHLVSAIDPAHDNDLALYWCHAMFQFNCRPLTYGQRLQIAIDLNIQSSFTEGQMLENGEFARGSSMIKDQNKFKEFLIHESSDSEDLTLQQYWDYCNVPKYYLDCMLTQRSADTMLGVPYNIASYALLTELFAEWTNMIPGDFIHSFGDVHIYENHLDAINEQLTRTPTKLPTVRVPNGKLKDIGLDNFNEMINNLTVDDFFLENYNPQSTIKAKLSTGLQ